MWKYTQHFERCDGKVVFYLFNHIFLNRYKSYIIGFSIEILFVFLQTYMYVCVYDT